VVAPFPGGQSCDLGMVTYHSGSSQPPAQGSLGRYCIASVMGPAVPLGGLLSSQPGLPYIPSERKSPGDVRGLACALRIQTGRPPKQENKGSSTPENSLFATTPSVTAEVY
jgi:hypothetical protein